MRFFEWCLIFLVIHLSLALIIPGVGLIISMILTLLCLITGTIAQAAELIEKSKVPDSYFRIVWACFLAGVLTAILIGGLGL